MNFERNCLSYWFPIIRDAGLPVPRTKIVRLPHALHDSMMRPLDGKPFGDECKPWFDELRAAVDVIGTPCFLRTGQTSGKHQWKDCCGLESADALEGHVLNLINFSECAGFGIPWDVWCVREMLPTAPVMILDDYGGMPLCKEFRCFVRDGEVVCVHPYWPKQSILEGMRIPDSLAGKPLRHLLHAVDNLYEDLIDGSDEPDIKRFASRAGKKVGGDWSVDILHTARGWFVTDMAIASISFHWEGCEKAAMFSEAAPCQ